MIEAVQAALARPEIIWLALTVLVAGCVRGFAGFGTGLIVMPLGSIFLPPVWIMAILATIDMLGSAPVVPRALRDGDVRIVGKLLLGSAIMILPGTYLLSISDPQLTRWAISAVVIGMVILLVSGWRHRLDLEGRELYAVGAASGLMGGMTGIPGPPVIIAFLGSHRPPDQVRANVMLFLLGFVAMLVPAFLYRGLVTLDAFAIGLVMLVPYIVGNLIGARVFNPAHVRRYRVVAQVLILSSGIAGMPIFSGA